MKEIAGKMVYETIAEIVDPKHTALLIVDIQNDHGARGHLAKHGRDVSWVAKILPSVGRVLEEARRRGILTIFTSNTKSKDHRVESAAQFRFHLKSAHRVSVGDYEVEGTWGNEVLEELRRRPEEPWIVKYRSSAFHGTRLDLILRNNCIESVVVAGLVTEGCVESTVRDILAYGYYPVVLRDCVTSSRTELHEAALLVMSARYDVISSDELIRVLNNARVGDE